MKKLPIGCPACQNQLKVKKLFCDGCETEIEGSFELPRLAKLPAEDQEFIVQFVKVSGSLKDMTRHLHLSYPTVRNQLNEIIGRINS